MSEPTKSVLFAAVDEHFTTDIAPNYDLKRDVSAWAVNNERTAAQFKNSDFLYLTIKDKCLGVDNYIIVQLNFQSPVRFLVKHPVREYKINSSKPVRKQMTFIRKALDAAYPLHVQQHAETVEKARIADLEKAFCDREEAKLKAAYDWTDDNRYNNRYEFLAEDSKFHAIADLNASINAEGIETSVVTLKLYNLRPEDVRDIVELAPIACANKKRLSPGQPPKLRMDF